VERVLNIRELVGIDYFRFDRSVLLSAFAPVSQGQVVSMVPSSCPWHLCVVE